MKQLTCEMCGITDLLKQDGIFVCQTCGCKYSVEEAKKLLIDGAVVIDRTNEVDNFANRMFSFIDDGNWNKAIEYLEKILDIDVDNINAYIGGILIKEKCLFKDFTNRIGIHLNILSSEKWETLGNTNTNTNKTKEIIQYLEKEYKIVNEKELQEERLIIECGERTFIRVNPIENLEDYSLCSCSLLTSVTIPTNLKTIGKSVFEKCDNLKSIIFSEDSLLTRIGNSAFYGCKNLTCINIPNRVTSIGGWSFYNCTSLKSINLPDSVTNIGFFAFSGCCSMTSIEISNNVTFIGDSVFCGCKSVETINLPNNLETIGPRAFGGCCGLKNITIPNSVKRIGCGAFQDCSSLTSISIPFIGEKPKGNTQEYFGYIFGGDYLNREKNIPKTLKEVIITGGNNICEKAFQGYIRLEKINIPSSVTSIGYNAFYGCRKLTSIVFEDITPWYRTTSQNNWKNKTDGTQTSVANTSINATNFTSMYGNYYWYKL